MLLEISTTEPHQRKSFINTDQITEALYDDKNRKLLIWFGAARHTEYDGDLAVGIAAILSNSSDEMVGKDFGLFKQESD